MCRHVRRVCNMRIWQGEARLYSVGVVASEIHDAREVVVGSEVVT